MHRLRQILRRLEREMRAVKNVLVSVRVMVRFVAPTGDDQKRIALCRTCDIKRLLRVPLAYFLCSGLVDVGNRRRPQEQLLDRGLIEPSSIAEIGEQRRQRQACSRIAPHDHAFFLMVLGPKKKLDRRRQTLIGHPSMI
jgi:hypothetical protein